MAEPRRDPARVDAKAGWCTNCRTGMHTMCTSPKCVCPDGRKHRRRPNYGSVGAAASRPPERRAPLAALPDPAPSVIHAQRSAPPARPAEPSEPAPLPAAAQPSQPPVAAEPAKATAKRPVFDLVREEPPAVEPAAPKATIAALLRPLLDRIDDDGWWRVATYPTRQGAAIARGYAKKAFGSTGWEWRAAPQAAAGSALYVRKVAE